MKIYAIKIDDMYLFEKMSIEDSHLTRRITQASKYDRKNETYHVIRQLVSRGIDEERISTVGFDYYTERDKETSQKVPFESKPLFNLTITRDELEELIAEVKQTKNSLQPVNDFIKKHYPGSLKVNANKRIYKALTPLYMETLGMDEDKAEELTEETLRTVYPTLSSESRLRIDVIEAIIEVLIYNEDNQMKEGLEMLNHLLDKDKDEKIGSSRKNI